MDPQFWHKRWEDRQIGFHRADVNPLLSAHLARLELKPGARIFVPLCGKTLDLGWLLARGFAVVGIELHEPAVQELFQELGVIPEVTDLGDLRHYRAPGLDVFAGDFFDLTSESLGPIAAIYDRAALVALPEDMRRRYATHLMMLANGAPQLLITFTYDQSRVEGPPFSLTPEFLTEIYANTYDLNELLRQNAEGGIKSIPATESVWLLHPKP